MKSLRLILAVFFLVPFPLKAQQLAFIPQPRSVSDVRDVDLPHGLAVDCQRCDAGDLFTANQLIVVLGERGIVVSDAATVRIRLQRLEQHPDPAFTDAMKPEGYTIGFDGKTLTLTGATSTGVFYAAQTAVQMVNRDLDGHFTLHAAEVRDWPAMRWRGVSDDQSRGPVDTLEFQKALVRTLAAYKVNLYSPYFEHTQQYTANPLPAFPGNSMSAQDARDLVDYARRFHVTVVPEQESIGHLHHVLVNEQYAALAETPHGNVLAPGQPGSLNLIGQDFTELAKLYPGPFLHLGADETADLGNGQTSAAVKARGLGPVYLDDLVAIQKKLAPLDRTLLYWGDVAENSPELLKALPEDFKQHTIAISWHYEAAAPQAFKKFLDDFKDAGLQFWVAPGVANWSTLYPIGDKAMANIAAFTAEGQLEGATGQLNTIWYDDGEGLALNNWRNLVFGAAAAWQQGTVSIPAFEAAFGPSFHGDMTGKTEQAHHELGAVYTLLDQAGVGQTTDSLFWDDPFAAENEKRDAKLRPILHDLRLHAERAITLLAEVRAAYAPKTAQRMSFLAEMQAAQLMRAMPTSGLQGTVGTIDPNPWPFTTLRNPDAIDALEFAARRFDFLGLKLQLADEVRATYMQAAENAGSQDKTKQASVAEELGSISSANGKFEDIRDGYAMLRGLYAVLWLRSYRAPALSQQLLHFNYAYDLWQSRIEKMEATRQTWDERQTLPPAQQAGIPAP